MYSKHLDVTLNDSVGSYCMRVCLYPVRAAGCSALFVLVVHLGHVGTAQQVVPLSASLLRTADISQTDLCSRLEEEDRGAERRRRRREERWRCVNRITLQLIKNMNITII